jgi:hypothetical protein
MKMISRLSFDLHLWVSRLAVVLATLTLMACAQTDSVTRNEARVTVHPAQDITEYSTPTIALRQHIDLTHYPVNLTIRGGCEGQGTRCRPDTVLWELDASAEYWQYQVDPQLEIFIDDVPYTFSPAVDPGPLGALSVVTQSRYLVPFGITERLALATNTRVRIGGNELQIDQRKKQPIVNMTRAIQGRQP